MTAKLATVDDHILAGIEAAGAMGGSIVASSAGDQPDDGSMQFDTGYLSPYFVTNPERMEVAFENACILIHEKQLVSKQDLLPLLEQITKSGRPLVIIAEDVRGEALATLIVKNLSGPLRVAAIRAPGSGNSAVWSLAAAASGPLFTGGRLTQQRRAAKAVFDQAKFQYSQSALRAFQEVSDALIASQKLSALEEQQKREVTALTESVAIANRRYMGGLASYYEVLEAQQLLYPAEFSLSETSRDRRLAVVKLYKALGGGWSLDNAQFSKGH